MGIRDRASLLARGLLGTAARDSKVSPVITVADDSGKTNVDSYWNEHTVNSNPFDSAAESKRYLKKRSEAYPLFTKFMDLYGKHEGQVVLDYGCGPGDDVVGFLLWSKARKVIGIDVSDTALGLLRHRLALHRVEPRRVELIRITDSSGAIPLASESIDWLHCGGVLHHTSHPQQIVNEFGRVMKPGAEGRLMLYNRESIWYHVWIAYAQRVVNNVYPELTVDEAFTKSTDGPDCPISDAWSPKRVLEMIEAAGLKGRFVGGYFNVEELGWWNTYGAAARNDPRLESEHREFASQVEVDSHGYPIRDRKHVGIGGVYAISKPGSRQL